MQIGKFILLLGLGPSLAFGEFTPQVVDKAAPKPATTAPVITPAAQTPAAKPGQTTPPFNAQNPAANGATPPAMPSMNSPIQDAMGVSPEPPANTNWDAFEYSDDHVFSYGGQGLKNIGNGLCVAKNKARSQATRGYCAMLADLLSNPNSCAGAYARKIISDPSSIRGFERYCPTYGRMTSEADRLGMLQQVLSTLIVQESGWNPSAQEKPWVKNGQPMGGKGMFQIGVNDRQKSDKYPDCRDINGSSIFDPQTNMKCGACIALREVWFDQAMGHGTGDTGARGMARYFGPLRDLQHAKRESMENAVKQYCTARTSGGSMASSYAPLTSGGTYTSTRTPTSTSTKSDDVVR